MSDRSTQGRSRLETPQASRFRFNFDAEAVGRVSESIARFLGTGRYLAIQTIVVIVWIALNIAAVGLQWDPYPFILLNLAFSTQAAYAAPLILLAQNRQENRDRVSLEGTAPAPSRRRRTPSSWHANSRPCDSRWARSRPATICVANSTTCAPCWSRTRTRTMSVLRVLARPVADRASPPTECPDVLLSGTPGCTQPDILL